MKDFYVEDFKQSDGKDLYAVKLVSKKNNNEVHTVIWSKKFLIDHLNGLTNAPV